MRCLGPAHLWTSRQQPILTVSASADAAPALDAVPLAPAAVQPLLCLVLLQLLLKILPGVRQCGGRCRSLSSFC